MGLFDEIKGLSEAAEKAAEEHPSEVKSAFGKLGEEVDAQTGGHHHDQIEQAEKKANDYIDQHATKTQPPAGT